MGIILKNQTNELGGYVILNDKKTVIAMDVGSTPEKKFSSNYQAGSLSFEIISNGKKLICNSGYFQDFKNKLNKLSKSTAIHSTLILNDTSSCKFTKNLPSKLYQRLKITKKNIVLKKIIGK